MSKRYKIERFFDKYNHLMEFIRTLTAVTVVFLQIIILVKLFSPEESMANTKQIETLNNKLKNDSIAMDQLGRDYYEIWEENQIFSSMLSEIENEKGGHEILKKLWDKNK